ncbi:MAG TPA: hypothetical protein VKG62_00625 [Solirubrobacteraceae bacterium]|nr:hypothetical protein [Solirubrobacteraceae bacterium]
MKSVKTTIGMLTAVCALGMMAAPAMAQEFNSTGGATKGVSEEEQSFKLGPFKIHCERAVSKGTATAGLSKTISDEVKFSKCLTEAKIGSNPIWLKTDFGSPLAIEYHANGFVEIGSEIEGAAAVASIGGGAIEVKIGAIGCTIEVPKQTVPTKAEKKPEEPFSEATFTNETYIAGSGKNEKQYTRLVIANAFSGIHLTYGGGQCEEFTKVGEELKSGKYQGTLPDEIAKGSLEVV